MRREQVLQEFIDAEAVLKGHFLLSSGMHSDTYMQCARVLVCPKRAARLAKALADKVREEQGDAFDIVAAPAMGGVVIGFALARELDLPYVFFERVNGVFALRRGFVIPDGARVLVCEDVVTTGLSSRETFDAITAQGGIPAGEAALVNRTEGDISAIGAVPLTTLLRVEADIFAADAVPEALKNIPAVKPGSRNIA